MLAFFTVLIMLIIAYAYWREGLFTACCMCVNVLLAGLIAFGFWEPVADLFDSILHGSFLAGYEDFFILIGLFALALGLLRMVTNNLCPNQIEYVGYFQQVGGAMFGLATGYLTAGFLVCALQTLPWHESFMNFEPRSPKEVGSRGLLPADRAWLSLMRYAGAHAFSWSFVEGNEEADDPFERYRTFDRHGTFELRYLRYRRYGDTRPPLPYLGEFNLEVQK
jgi:hypothetical protein